MKKRVSLLIFMLLFSVIICESVNFACAQTITIMSDGSVKGTNKIQRDGNVYIFTDDISGTIKIEKNDVTIDGAGYAIKGSGNGITLRKDNTADMDISPAYSGIVVKNVRFCDKNRIFASATGNCFSNNIFEGGGIIIRGGDYWGSDGDVITYNVFIDCMVAIEADYCGGVEVRENDFINCKIACFIYSKLGFRMNYWSDYTALYPDAKEVGNTGIWDTPYKNDNEAGLPFFDYHPLVKPVNGAGIPEINEKPTPPTTSTDGDSMPTSTIFPDEEKTTSTNGDRLKSFPIALIMTASIVSGIIVITSLLIYFKKRK